jgi:hypothetical protein
MNFTAMRQRVALRCNDPLQKILGDTEYAGCTNDAIQDLAACGWLLPIEEDETTTLVANTYEYEVPAGFAYIRELRYEDDSTTPSTYDYVVPFEQWRAAYNGAGDDGPVSQIIFDSRLFDGTSGDHIKVVGQKRPVELAIAFDEEDGDWVITPGMEPFIRERAIAYAARTMAMLLPDRALEQTQAMEGESPPGTHVGPIMPDAEERRARRLLALAEVAWRNSEMFLANHPSEFRVQPGSIPVPGR